MTIGSVVENTVTWLKQPCKLICNDACTHPPMLKSLEIAVKKLKMNRRRGKEQGRWFLHALDAF